MMGKLQKALMNESLGLANLLRQRGFIDMVSTNHRGENIFMADYGPLGALLRHNIFSKWWELMVSAQTNVFPVESPVLEQPSIQRALNSSPDIRHSLQPECAAKYLQVLKLTNGKLPISVASVGECISPKKIAIDSEKPEEQFLLLGSAIKTKLTLQNYVPPANANTIHDYWLRTRLSWWKKFSRNPERFSVTSETACGNKEEKREETSSGGSGNGSSESHMNITYQFPWGQEVVESVSNLGDRLLKQMPQDDPDRYLIKTPGKKAFLPACIECDTSIETVMASWLVDAYQERYPATPSGKISSRSKMQQVLQLHHQISPYQVAISMTSPSSSSTSSSTGIEMRYICNNVEKDLKKAGVSVFNTSSHGGTLDAHFRRNDQLGIMYTVIINQSTLTDGLVNTRSRDTQIKVSSHISSLVSELTRNLNARLE